MKYLMSAVLIVLALLLALGCAQRQEDAAKLEREMLGQDTLADTAVDAATVPPEMTPVDAAQTTPPEPEESASAEITAPVGEGYTLQIASCPSMSYAQYLIDKFENRGFEPYMTSAVVDGQTYYRVRLGQFEDRAEVEKLKAKIEDMYSIVGWVDGYSN